MKVLSPTGKRTAVRESHVVNWILARFLSLPKPQREAWLREGMAIVDRHLDKDEPYKVRDDRPLCPGDLGPGPDAGDRVGPDDTGRPPGGSAKRTKPNRKPRPKKGGRDRKASGVHHLSPPED